MDVKIQEVQSRIEATDSQSLLDPRIMRQIVQVCVQAVKEELARDKRRQNDRELSSGIAPERQ
jgi:predicted proteasome-type protease